MGYNKIIYHGRTLIDLTACTVTPETLAAGITAYNAAGNLITGAGVLIGFFDVPAKLTGKGYNKIIYNGRTLIDLTPCTVSPETLQEGVTAYDARGNLITGIGVFADRVEANAYSGLVVYEYTKERHELLREN